MLAANDPAIFPLMRRAAAAVDKEALVRASDSAHVPGVFPASMSLEEAASIALPPDKILGWAHGEASRELHIINAGDGRLRIGLRLLAALSTDPAADGPSDGGKSPVQIRQDVGRLGEALLKASRFLSEGKIKQAETWLAKAHAAVFDVRLAAARAGAGRDHCEAVASIFNEIERVFWVAFGIPESRKLQSVTFSPGITWPVNGVPVTWEGWVKARGGLGDLGTHLSLWTSHEDGCDGVAGLLRAKGDLAAPALFAVSAAVVAIQSQMGEGGAFCIPEAERIRDQRLLGLLNWVGLEWTKAGGIHVQRWDEVTVDGPSGPEYRMRHVPPVHGGNGILPSALQQALQGATGWLAGLRDSVGFPFNTPPLDRRALNFALASGPIADPALLFPEAELDRWSPPGWHLTAEVRRKL